MKKRLTRSLLSLTTLTIFASSAFATIPEDCIQKAKTEALKYSKKHFPNQAYDSFGITPLANDWEVILSLEATPVIDLWVEFAAPLSNECKIARIRQNPNFNRRNSIIN